MFAKYSAYTVYRDIYLKFIPATCFVVLISRDLLLYQLNTFHLNHIYKLKSCLSAFLMIILPTPAHIKVILLQNKRLIL